MQSNNEELPKSSVQPAEPVVVLDQKMFEDAVSKALAGFFPSISSKVIGSDPRAEFFHLYERESDEYDKEFIKKYDEDANTTLIFAGLFSAVASAFLIDAQKNLQQDYAQVSAALLQILVFKVNNATFSSADFPLPTWSGPTSTMVNVQCLLYTSLAASMIAAFGAMLGKQWINLYSRVGNRGSLMDRSRDRQRKFDGMARWHFNWLMESLPLMLQSALLLLGLALSLYLWTIFTLVGVVLIFFTSLGLLFYVTIIVCGTIWYDCPFQTPASIFFHAVLEYDNKHSRHLPAMYKILRSAVDKCSSMITWAWGRFMFPVRADVEAAVPEVELLGHGEMQEDPIPLFTEEQDTNWKAHIADARCISWMQEISTDADVAIATTRFISEVEWHSGIVTTPPLDKLWHEFVSCYDPARLSDHMVAATRDKAYSTLKALMHLKTQRRSVSDTFVLQPDSLDEYYDHPLLKPDIQLLTVIMLLHGLINNEFDWMHDQVSQLPDQHLSWTLHIVAYRLLKDESVLGESLINLFISEVLERGNRSRSVLTDCFLVIGLRIGTPVHINDLMVIDKSKVLDEVVYKIFKQIALRFEHHASPEQIQRTMNALETLTHWNEPPDYVSVACYDLCPRILGSTIKETIKRRASQLVMEIGFRHSPSVPDVNNCAGGLVTGLTFLEHHFALENLEEWDYNSIADCFSALCNISPEDVPWTKSFLSGMVASLKVDTPSRLKAEIIRFIMEFQSQILNGGVEAMSEEEKRMFFALMSSEPDNEDGKLHCMTILIHALRSPVSRPYLGLEHLSLLESFIFISTTGPGVALQAVYQGVHDAELIPALLADENFLGGAILKFWLKATFLSVHVYGWVPEVVIEQMRSAIKNIFIQRPDVMDEFRMAIDSCTQFEIYESDTDKIQRAKDELENLCEDGALTIRSGPEHEEVHAPSTSLA